MLVNLREKKKLILLHSAYRRGIIPLTRQLYLSLLDIFLRRKYLVFALNIEPNSSNIQLDRPQINIQFIRSWEDIPSEIKSRLISGNENIEWGNRSFFSRPRKLWALRLDNRIATLGWLASPEFERDFIWPVPDTAEILHQVTVLPEFRGRGLQILHQKMLIDERVKIGVTSFYISCHEYNTTSHRNILRTGFSQIGYSRRSRLTGRLTVHPQKYI